VALDEILRAKHEAVAARQHSRPLPSFRDQLERSGRSLAEALRQPHCGFILECKKASPSQGLIRADFDPRAIGETYAPFADAISVITDEPFFQGSLENLRLVRETADQPLLCKDFVVDPYQIYEARSHGADAILLMCSVLDQALLLGCLEICAELGMDALVEVHDEQELSRALSANAPIIGINNRDLRSLQTDLAVTERLAGKIPDDRIRICESGIGSHHDVLRLRPQVDAFLVGTTLMRQPRLDHAVRELIFGRVKICGLRRGQDVEASERAGARFGGLLLWPPSPRSLSLEQAETLTRASNLPFVGVFVDQPINEMVEAAERLELAAVQLHGDEDADTIAALRERLPARCRVWQAHRVGNPEAGPPPASAATVGADRLLLDTYQRGAPGGTGKRFDWALARNHPARSELILSGGLSPDSAAAADAVGCWALDVSSGVESAPGVKEPSKLQAFFAALRG